MAYNQNFYNNFRANDFTFQRNFLPPTSIPPPPLPPPPFYIAPISAPQETDQEFVKRFEVNLQQESKQKPKSISISQVCDELRNLLLIINEIKNKEKSLSDNIDSMSDNDWKLILEEIEKDKVKVNEYLTKINSSQLDMLRTVIAKRTAKRMRLKRLRLERKREKEDMIKQAKERSRKIDENLQKIKDDINKMKQEEEAKLQADMVLKEVLRKKSDAKKCLTKLDALLKLRRARQNTAKGRGETVSESDAAAFNGNIEKLKALWTQRLSLYEKEEAELRDKLKEDTKDQPTESNERDEQVVANLAKWQVYLFGDKDTLPQRNFGGDIGRFVAVRSQWDQFVSTEGSPLPIGWVVPNTKPSSV